MSTPILTATEVKQYVTRILMAYRQDLEQEMAAGGGRLTLTTELEFYAVLHDLARRFELDPLQQALACTAPVCLLYDPPDVPLIVVQGDGRRPMEGESESGHGKP